MAAAQPTAARGSITGVRLTGPAGFRQAGSKAVLEVVGAAAGARYQLRGPGLDVTVVAGSDGALTRSVTLPEATTTASYVLFGADGQVADDTRVLGRKTLKVSTLAVRRSAHAGPGPQAGRAGEGPDRRRGRRPRQGSRERQGPLHRPRRAPDRQGEGPRARRGPVPGAALRLDHGEPVDDRRPTCVAWPRAAGRGGRPEPRARVGPRSERGDVHVRRRGQRRRRLPRDRRHARSPRARPTAAARAPRRSSPRSGVS